MHAWQPLIDSAEQDIRLKMHNIQSSIANTCEKHYELIILCAFKLFAAMIYLDALYLQGSVSSEEARQLQTEINKMNVSAYVM